MGRVLLMLACSALLAGCATTTPAERLANNQDACSSYGFTSGTDAYASCMMQMDLADQEDDYRRRQALSEGLREMGRSMQRNRPVTCNSFGNANRFGSSVYGTSTTTCY